jgi:CDP-6-deoxy-D-xylo-4-hexulose-3-dehydrase
MTTIEGGMISTNNREMYELARMFRSHGMTREASPETHAKYAKPDVNPLFTFAVPGYNMRSTELNAVLGLQQLPRLDSNISARVRNLDVWLQNLDPSKYFIDFKVEGSSNYALPLIWKNLEDKAAICRLLEDRKVEYRLGTAGGGNQARQPYLERYAYKKVGTLQVSDYIQDHGLYIGNHPELREADIIELCERLNNV